MIGKYTALKFCNEDISFIENYKKAINDTENKWECHHRLEIDESKSKQQLIDEGRYYNRPAYELIFLTKSEHMLLHNNNLRQETRKKMSEANKGRCLSEEAKKKISEANKGKRRSEETRKKISEAAKKQVGPNKGKPMSEETKKKISQKMIGRKAPWNSHPMSEETKEKLHKIQKGRKVSEEAKQKMREARLKYWKNKHEN